MTTITSTDARARLFALLRRATRGHEMLRIQYRSRGAVLLGEEDFESLLETLTLLSTPGFLSGLRRAEEDARRGRISRADEVLRKKVPRRRVSTRQRKP